MTKQAHRRVYFDTFRDLPTVTKTLAHNSMASDIVSAVFLSEDYARLVEEGFCFRLAEILTYWVGSAFAGGGQGKMWADCLFEFKCLTDEEQVLLMMRDNFTFSPERTSEWDKAYATGCEWENKRRLLANMAKRTC